MYAGLGQDRDRALTQVQAVAETVRHCGDIEAALTQLHGEAYEQDGVYWSFYDADWNYLNSVPGCGTEKPAAVFRLGVRRVAREGAGPIGDDTVVTGLDVAWQEEVGGYAG